MPYIPQQTRLDIDPLIRPIESFGNLIKKPGDLNYVITKLLLGYLDAKGTSYQTINDCIGVLECAKLEMYRRLAAGYEDRQIQKNGDVYGR